MLADEALAEAEAPQPGPLYGAPIAVKDVIDVAGARTTAASAILADNVARRDAMVVERLRAAGAIVLGKLNTHEFAFGALTTSPHFGPARNPWAPDRVCGGSSGGSGAAAAAGPRRRHARDRHRRLGPDPGLPLRRHRAAADDRPRLERRRRSGRTWTFDTVGPIARSAEDCALLLDAIAGTRTDVQGGIEGLRVGVVEELLDRADPDVESAVRAAIDELAALGARVEEAEVPWLEEAGTIQQLAHAPGGDGRAPAVATRAARRLRGRRAGAAARRALAAVRPPTSRVCARSAATATASTRVLARFDLLAAPAMPVVAPRIGEETVTVRGETMPYRLALIPFNSPWSLAGLPAASVPCGFVDGLPVGLSLVGRRLGEETVLRAAHAYQSATDWHERRPRVGPRGLTCTGATTTVAPPGRRSYTNRLSTDKGVGTHVRPDQRRPYRHRGRRLRR